MRLGRPNRLGRKPDITAQILRGTRSGHPASPVPGSTRRLWNLDGDEIAEGKTSGGPS
jgi:hypothetical protein